MKITYSKSFKKSFKKKIENNPELEKKFWNKIELFLKEPYHSNLKTHKLTGKLKDLWSFRIDYDIRVIFYFTNDNNAVFISMGSHDEVY